MAADIQWNDVVGQGTYTDGGHIGDLLKVARAHVDDAVSKNRLTQKDAGQVYTAMIPAAIQEAIKFVMDEKLLEAQIDKAKADAETAKALASEARAKALAEIIKVYGFGNATMDPITHEITVGVNTSDGKLDYDNRLIMAQVTKAAKDTDVAERQTVVTEAQSAQDLLVKEEQVNSQKLKRAVEVLNVQTSSWTSVFNSGKLDLVPDMVNDVSINSAYNKAKGLV